MAPKSAIQSRVLLQVQQQIQLQRPKPTKEFCSPGEFLECLHSHVLLIFGFPFFSNLVSYSYGFSGPPRF